MTRWARAFRWVRRIPHRIDRAYCWCIGLAWVALPFLPAAHH